MKLRNWEIKKNLLADEKRKSENKKYFNSL